MQTFAAITENDDYFSSEFVINDAPISARNLLTKGFVQDEICQYSGAAMSTRGRFMSKSDAKNGKNPTDRPLYLFVQGPTKQSVELAVQKIDDIIRSESGNVVRANFNRPGEMMQNEPKHQSEKIFVGLDNTTPVSFDLRSKIIGQGGSNLQYIRSETGAAVSLRGRGSQFVDPQLGHEAPDPMHLLIEHTQPEGLLAARQLAVNLIETLAQEMASDTQNINNQMMSHPPRMMGMPPLSVPPPQQFTAVSSMQQVQNIEQPIIISGNPPDQHMRNPSIQHVQQMPPQQVMLQQPPPLARAPIVNIPPPGIHIPQHPGPMVPPPQIVQLPTAPPTAVSSGSVLVVAPPPTQPLYIPQDMGAPASASTFSFLQGGVLYHQAPPIQTQAQIGDGLHIISAPPQAMVDNVNISINSHTHPPPPHMIITQVQLDSNVQNSGKQIPYQQSAVSQHQKTQFVIGHMSDSTTVQASQGVENFGHFSANNQTSTPTSIVFTVPYHMSGCINTSSTTAISVSQIPQMNSVSSAQNMTIQQHSDLENAMKQLPRQIMQTGILPMQRQRNDRPPIAIQLSNNQNPATIEQIILNQPPNTQAIISQIPHVPPNQIIGQLPPGQMQGNTFLPNQNSLLTNQSNPVMVTQHELSQVVNNQNHMAHLPPIPTNHLPPQQVSLNQMVTNSLISNQISSSHLPPNQMINQEQINLQSSQIPRQQPHHLPYGQMSYDHIPSRQDNLNRNRLNQTSRVRKQGRLNRQNSFSWNKNDSDKLKYQNDSVWQNRDGDRNYDFDRNHDDYVNDRSRHQQCVDNSQLDDRKSQQRSNSDRMQYDCNIMKSNNLRSYQTYEKHEGITPDSMNNTWKRCEKGDNHLDESISDSGRKRKYESDNAWNSSRLESNQSMTGETSNLPHKSRFEPEDSMKIEAGSQQKQSLHKISSNLYGVGDQTKPENDNSSKWLEPSGDSLRCSNTMDKMNDDKLCELSRSNDHCHNPVQNESHLEKSNDMSLVPCSWNDQSPDIKPNNAQFASAGQYQVQSINDGDKQFNANYQHGFMNPIHVYQNNIPYMLPPPPPPPPHTQQSQHNMPFNISQCSSGNLIQNAPPPPIQVVNNINQPLSIQNAVVPNINQSIPPNIVSSMSSHLISNVPPSINMPNSISQNVPYDIGGQNIMSSVSQTLPTNVNQNISSSLSQTMPPGIAQNIAAAVNIQQSQPQMTMNQNVMSSMPPPYGGLMGGPQGMATTNQQSLLNQSVIPMSMSSGSSLPMGMQPVIGQLGPAMVPPPTAAMMQHHGCNTQNMVPTPVLSSNMNNSGRTQITQNPPPPPPTSMHAISTQSAYPFWMERSHIYPQDLF